MNKMIALMLAASASALLAAAPAYAQDASYKSLTDKASADYKQAKAACDSHSGNAKKVCVEEARVARAKADSDAVAEYRNTPRELTKARKDVANAEYDLAKAKCGDRTGADKTTCMNDAKAAKTAALADANTGAKAGTNVAQNPPATTKENCDAMDAPAKAACVTRNAAGSTKTAVADSVITTKIKADLVKDNDLKALDVHVETVNGVVMLSGFVPSQAQVKKAADLARGVEGVTDVKNGLKVK
ncbi:BON domain-containing protein [Janthinobacterium sp. GW460P]|uniref:BON domain-containing protein n=1 Tax=unclassified Janthinobacterium TaxID=2610881 RepID=UPI000A3269A6|nr:MULTISPECIES: BON domain-containing protein [unclassified Janthinobacterium]MCC7701994.1 BON domain-containing protein [Janthinobacterium sp. GW460P]MCC7707502.1 BON domain-containing protein [Janthinobacterium sp. GW460W]